MSQDSRSNKRSLDKLKEDNTDVAAVNRVPKQGKIDEKGKAGSNSKENDNETKSNEKYLEMFEEDEDDDVPINIKELLLIREDDIQKSDVMVVGLKQLEALKYRNDLPYGRAGLWKFHVVPQYPQTRAKDEEMQKYLRPPDWVPPPQNPFSEQEMAQLSEYMIDKKGDMVNNNIDVHKVLKDNNGIIPRELVCLLSRVPPYVPPNAPEYVFPKNFATMEGYESKGIDGFVAAFTNLLDKSNSFLEENSREPIKIYVPDYDREITYYHVINFIPRK